MLLEVNQIAWRLVLWRVAPIARRAIISNMNPAIFKKRKIIIRAALPLLAAAFWMLGNVNRNYWIKDSPDGRFSTSLVQNRGWRSADPGNRLSLYVTDNQTGEVVLATTLPQYCVFEMIALHNIEWDDNRRFACLWTIQNNGEQRQYFKVEAAPLRVKASAPCCATR